MKNYYKILQIEISATQAEIKSQYHFLLHAWHSDKFPYPEQKDKAEERTKEIIEAYKILSEPTQRANYDKELAAFVQSKHHPTTHTNQNSNIFTEDNSMIAVIIEIAKSVITALIIDFIKEKRKGADKKQVEQQILAEVVKRVDGDSKEIKHVAQKVMDEVEILSARTPMLKVTQSSIELAQPIKKPLFGRDNTNALLAERLQEFDHIVSSRRKQLGLPTEPEPIKVETKSPSKETDAPEGWEKVDSSEQKDSQWEKEVFDMQDRIRERRQKISKGK